MLERMFGRFRGRENTPPVLWPESTGAIGASAVAAANEATPVEGPVRLAVGRARKHLPREVADIVLPEYKAVEYVTEETFCSPMFMSAAYNTMPERYGNHDGSLTIITLDNGVQVFMAAGKVSSDNPWDAGHAADGGLDLRQDYVVVYVYDGQQTITEYLPGEENKTYKGEFGTPEALLPSIRASLGVQVGSEAFRGD